jgi:hypothetical protein
MEAMFHVPTGDTDGRWTIVRGMNWLVINGIMFELPYALADETAVSDQIRCAR